jgi:hypothetical protein
MTVENRETRDKGDLSEGEELFPEAETEVEFL